MDRVCESADFAGWPFRVGVADGLRIEPEEAGSRQGQQHSEICGAGFVGLLLGFSFAIAGARHEARRELLVEEANSIVTTARRAQLLPEPHAANMVQLLSEYVPLRIEAS